MLAQFEGLKIGAAENLLKLGNVQYFTVEE